MIIKKIINFILVLYLIFCILLAAVFVVPHLIGYDVISENTTKMTPDIDPGSIVYIKKCDIANVSISDICAFKTGEGTEIGRIEYIDYETNSVFYSKNKSEIYYCSSFDELLGKMTSSISNFGLLFDFISSPNGIAIAISSTVFFLMSSIIIDTFTKFPKAEAT